MLFCTCIFCDGSKVVVVVVMFPNKLIVLTGNKTLLGSYINVYENFFFFLLNQLLFVHIIKELNVKTTSEYF